MSTTHRGQNSETDSQCESLPPLLKAAAEGRHDAVSRLIASAGLEETDKRTGRTALHFACLSGSIPTVCVLLDSDAAGVIVNGCDDTGQTALHLACLGGHVTLADRLLRAGANIDECDESGRTPLKLAASEGHDEIVTCLLSAGANAQKQDINGRTVLHHACVSGCLKVVCILLTKHLSLMLQGDAVQHTPLMLAASQGHHKVVQFLASMPVDIVQMKSKCQQTALHLACLAGHLEVAAILLRAGAKFDECDVSGLTPLMLAASQGHDGVVTRLLRAGANVREQDSDGKTALHHAAEQGTKLSVEKCVKSGARVNHTDVFNHTPLTVAAIKEKYEVAIQLILTGADVTHLTRHEGRDLAEEVLSCAIQLNLTQNSTMSNCQNFCALFQQGSAGVNLQNWDTYKHSVATLILRQLQPSTLRYWYPALLVTHPLPRMTELMWAAHKGYVSLVKYLICRGVNVNVQYSTPHTTGNTALHFAAQGNHIQCGLLLAKAGANVETTNKKGYTPLGVATVEFRSRIWEMLSFQTKKLCCVLGNSGNGKSTLIASLQNENAKVFTKFRRWLFGARIDNISRCTAGIEPVSLTSKRYGNVLFYDFAGQHEYHGPHELFLESIIRRGLSSIAVVAVVNITLEQSKMFTQLDRWLRPFYKLPSTTYPIPVILVGSHLDKADKHEQDEVKHNLYMCCEQLKNQGDSVLQFGYICCLDCRQPYAPDIQKLCKYLRDVLLPRCDESHTGYSLQWVTSLIRSSFRTEEVLPLSRFADWICQNKANLPDNLPPAEDVCRHLASTGHFLYFPSKRGLSESSWLVLNLPVILKDIYGNLFSKPTKLKVNKFGLLSCAQLPALFPRLKPSLVHSILLSLGFGVEVDPSFLSEATLSHFVIEGSDRQDEHLFIPALVTAKCQPNNFTNTNNGSAHIVCWQFEVEKKLPLLSPRILQAVILQLASNHVFTPTAKGSEVSTRTPQYCDVWLNGIFWQSREGADIAVQISDNNTIHVIGHSEVSESAERLCKCMSKVVQDIARTIKSIDPSIHGSAYIVCPQPANPQFLLDNPLRPPAHDQTFPIDVMLECIRQGSKNTISLSEDCKPGVRKTFNELFGGFMPSMEAVKILLVLQDSPAQPTDPSSRSTASTEPHPSQVLPTTEHTDPPGASDHTGMLDGTNPTTPTGPALTTPTGTTLTTPTGTTLTTPTGPTLTTPTLTTPTLTLHNDPLMSVPNMELLDKLVVLKIASEWHRVCIHLGIPPEVQKAIQANHPSNVEQCCHNMFIRWLSPKLGSGAKPRTWESVLTALQKADYSPVAEDVRREITGRTAIMSSSNVVTPSEDILPPYTGTTLPTLTNTTPDREVLANLVVNNVAAQWDVVGVHLGITPEIRQIVRANSPRDVEQCCRVMFDRWLFYRKGTGEKPRTWESVLSALENANYSNVAANLRRELDPAS